MPVLRRRLHRRSAYGREPVCGGKLDQAAIETDAEQKKQQENRQPVEAAQVRIALREGRSIRTASCVETWNDDIVVAMQKIELIDDTLKRLPGLDCGSCGSPTCRALAEDIVQGTASETDCVFRLREMVRDLAQEMVNLSEKLRRR